MDNRASGPCKIGHLLPAKTTLSKGIVLIENVPQRIDRDIIDEDFVMQVGTG
jgi:hypothetical protein